MSAGLADHEHGAEASPLLNALAVLRERWRMVLALTVAALVVSLLIAATSSKQYSAHSSLLVRPSNLTSLIDPTTSQSPQDPARNSATNLLLVTSTAVAQRVHVVLKTPESADDLLKKIDAVAEPDADLITITARDHDPQRAATLANTFASQFVAYQRNADRQRATDGEQLLRSQLAALPPFDNAQRAQLQQALQKVISLRAVTTGNAQVVDQAVAPSQPSSPKLTRSALLGLIVGLVLGLSAAFLIELVDRRVKSVEEFESLYGFRALGSIGLLATGRGHHDRTGIEPFRILRDGLGFLAPTTGVRVVLVTSAVAAEGKSTVAAGLARATALTGKRVVLVEADLRRPSMREQFDLGTDRRGLTTALVGGVSAESLLRTAMPGSTLSVLPSGPIPPNSAELLRSPEMGLLLRELRDDTDMVVIDAPPVLPVADAQALLDHDEIDACLVVARAYQTTRDQVRRARAVFERHRLARYGLVVNGVHEHGGGYDYYYAVPSEDGESVVTARAAT